MADNSDIKTIKQRVAALKELMKTQEGLTAAKQKELTLLRQELKDVRTLGKAEKKRLDTLGDREFLEKLHHKNLKDEGTFGKELREISKSQLDLQLKSVQGQLTSADVAGQLAKIAIVEEEAIRQQEQGHSAIAEKLMDQVKHMQIGLTAMEDMNEAVEYENEIRKEIDENLGGMMGKFDALKEKAGKFGKMLQTPHGAMLALGALAAAAAAAVVKLVLSTRELQKEMGFSAANTAKMQGAMLEASYNLRFMGISGEEVKQTTQAIIEEFGTMGNVSQETLTTMGNLHATLGIAGSDAAKLLGMMESVSGASRETLLANIENAGELARAAGVAPSAVMADVASNTDLFADFAKDGGENIMEAATQARALGLNLSTVSKIADSLLDFETSIQKSMEASMMLGRNINTDRARQLALEGDLAGMQKEILSQVGSEAEFNNMNRLQRTALAEAFGMNTAELSKMVREQETLNKRWGLVSWVLEKLSVMTGMFRKLKPILEVLGVIVGAVLLPAMIKMGVIGIKNLMVEIAAFKVKHGLSLKQIATDARDIALKVIKLPLTIKDLALTIAGNVAKGTRNVLEAIGNTTAVAYLGTLIATGAMKAKDLALTIAKNAAVGVQLAIMGAITVATWLWTAAQWALNIAMAANPLGLIILAIVFVVGLVVLLMKKFKGFGDVVKKALDMAFAPLLWAWDMLKSVGSFIGGLFGGGEKKPAEAASPAVAMADGGVVNSATTAKIGEAGPEAVVPLGDKFDLSKIEEKLAELIAINKLNLPAINKKVGDIGVAG
jgi:hypothetical protein